MLLLYAVVIILIAVALLAFSVEETHGLSRQRFKQWCPTEELATAPLQSGWPPAAPPRWKWLEVESCSVRATRTAQGRGNL